MHASLDMLMRISIKMKSFAGIEPTLCTPVKIDAGAVFKEKEGYITQLLRYNF
jgi:hypothetical protein